MVHAEPVSSDPLPCGRAHDEFLCPPCFACQTQDRRKPSLLILLDEQQVRARATADTGTSLNPFATLDVAGKSSVYLCTACRDKNAGWQVLCNPRRYGAKSASRALRLWKRRCSPDVLRNSTVSCFICSRNIQGVQWKRAEVGSRANRRRNPTRDWTLFNLISDGETVRSAFTDELIRLSECDNITAQELLRDPSVHHLCYVHLNHSRISQERAMRLQRTNNSEGCVFMNCGCVFDNDHREKSRLWRINSINVNTLEDMEELSQFDDNIRSHSNGYLSASDVRGQYSCRSCLYIITEGSFGKLPNVSVAELSSPIDRWLVRFIKFSVASSAEATKSPLTNSSCSEELSAVAMRLRVSCKSIQVESGENVRLLPFADVMRARARLSNIHGSKWAGPLSSLDRRTVAKIIETALAAEGIILKKLSARLRVYVRADEVRRLLAGMIAAGKGTTSADWIRPSYTETRACLESVSKRFRKCKDIYWNGKWSLSTEVASIPRALWTDTVLMMASQKKINSWKLFANTTGGRLVDTFPVSNDLEALPHPSIEEALNENSEYSRYDLVLCVRVLKVIEQMVLSRTNGVSGPLTVSTSISGICEVSPSYLSVLNAMGMFLSYNVTERYRQKLIADRERKGPWEYSRLDPYALPTLQFDNWDIKPLHAVKADQKAMPKVNGSLLQAVTQKRKPEYEELFLPDAKRRKTEGQTSWRPQLLLGDREAFGDSFSTPETQIILDRFNDVVFGITALFRNALVGGHEQKKSEYNTSTREQFGYKCSSPPINFRTLLLSCFKPHGGAAEPTFDQHVIYVEISRDSAADILSVRRFLNLIVEQLKPGKPGRPRYVVLAGDQPSYKMFSELWLESWRKSKKDRDRMTTTYTECDKNEALPLHDWLVPYPGFFHAEKQAMYSLCKEMLDGLGLEELAGCTGLSKSQVENILSHSHARNNRAVLFNLACAMIIHLTDILVGEDDDIEKRITRMHADASRKIISADTEINPDEVHRQEAQIRVSESYSRSVCSSTPGRLYDATSDMVTAEVLEIGRILRRKVEYHFTNGPNGKHFITTVLFSCLLPTIGFHVISRTGHTDCMDAFWFKHNSILHSTNHLKYQELSLFYAFFRGILPTFVSNVLFTEKPGKAVLKLLSFTGKEKGGMDRRGWVYVHQDEALEMLIVRHLKGLSVNFINHLENAASWLMEVSLMRALTRYVTGASRAFGRKREIVDGGELPGPLGQFDRNARQWTTVARMVHVMREAGFLGIRHRGAERLTNVFSTPPKMMNIMKDQEMILNIASEGALTAKLHACVLFPEVFGHLSEEDRSKHFYGKKFKKWTKARTVLRPSQSMSKKNGTALQTQDSTSAFTVVARESASSGVKRPKGKEAYVKLLNDRRRKLSKMKDCFSIALQNAVAKGQNTVLEEFIRRWEMLHNKRYLVTAFADSFWDNTGNICHSPKSRFLKYGARGNREVCYPLNNFAGNGDISVSQNLYGAEIVPYFSLQVDVMNALHYRGSTGERGTVLREVVTGKMKNMLRPWVTGTRAKYLSQVHLHIDDPSLVLRHKSAEQQRRDDGRSTLSTAEDDAELSSHTYKMGFGEELNVPWSSLLNDRKYKDELASLHLFCGAAAVSELLMERDKSCCIYLHGGNFAIETTFTKSSPHDFIPMRCSDMLIFEDSLTGFVILKNKQSGSVSPNDSTTFRIPRNRCIVFKSNGTACLGHHVISHGEAETRFVSVIKNYVMLPFMAFTAGLPVTSQRRSTTPSATTRCSGSLILSDDTDVFIILLCNTSVHGIGVMHVINDSLHGLDECIASVEKTNLTVKDVCMAYCLAGCDFCPSFFGLNHDTFIEAMKQFHVYVGSLTPCTSSQFDNMEMFVCLTYLFRHGKRILLTPSEEKELITKENPSSSRNAGNNRDILVIRKSAFVSKHAVGSVLWKIDVYNFVADLVTSSNQLVPPRLHLDMQMRRAGFVLEKYWSRSSEDNLCPNEVGGCSTTYGFNTDGSVLLELEKDISIVHSDIKAAVLSCRCKGECSTRRCTCFKNGLKCVACDCTDHLCKNSADAVASQPEASGLCNENLDRAVQNIGSNQCTVAGENDGNIETVPLISDSESEASVSDGGSEKLSSVHSGDIDLEDLSAVL